MFKWLGVSLLTVAVAIVSETKISSSVLTFVSPAGFGFPLRLLR